jgi:hypothetical protein
MAQSQVLEFEGSARAEDGTQGSEESNQRQKTWWTSAMID